MTTVLQMHPVSDLNQHLDNRHRDDNENNKRSIQTFISDRDKSDKCQHQGSHKADNMVARSFVPPAAFDFLLSSRLIDFFHVGLTHLSEKVNECEYEYPHDVDKVPI